MGTEQKVAVITGASQGVGAALVKGGIRVNAVAPGIIKSPMHPVETHTQLDRMHAVWHTDEMSDIVNAILYLESANFVTGVILHVDGGQSAGR